MNEKWFNLAVLPCNPVCEDWLGSTSQDSPTRGCYGEMCDDESMSPTVSMTTCGQFPFLGLVQLKMSIFGTGKWHPQIWRETPNVPQRVTKGSVCLRLWPIPRLTEKLSKAPFRWNLGLKLMVRGVNVAGDVKDSKVMCWGYSRCSSEKHCVTFVGLKLIMWHGRQSAWESIMPLQHLTKMYSVLLIVKFL